MEMREFERFRLNLDAAMEATGTSQRTLAALVGVSYPHLNRILRGKAVPSISLCGELAGAAGYTLQELLDDPREFAKRAKKDAERAAAV